MGIGVRKYNRFVKSLMHFDYPYFAEAGDGLRDEIGTLSWSKTGSAELVGVEQPVMIVVTGTPKFGWRCLQTESNSDYIMSTVNDNYLDIDSDGRYEVECFIRKVAATAGNILVMLNDSGSEVFKIASDANNKITVTSTPLNANATTSSGLTLSTWQHVRVRIEEGALTVFIAGIKVYEGAVSGQVSNVSEVRFGGINGQFDEFRIQATVSDDSVPSEPYRGIFDAQGIGGDGHHGELNLQSGTNYINTSYMISTIQSKQIFTVNSLTQATNSVGIQGQAQVGDELLIIKRQKVAGVLDPIESGLYALKKIRAISSTTFTLENEITEMEFTQNELTNYAIEAILVPHYTKVTIGAEATCQPVAYSTYYGGLIVFRCKGNVTVNGKLITSGIAANKPHGGRIDYYQMTHYHLPERFITGNGGGVIILSEGRVTIPDTARVGGTWDGSILAGTGGAGGAHAGTAGGSGYGGGGSGCTQSSHKGGAGGVGGGGGCGGAWCNGLAPNENGNKTAKNYVVGYWTGGSQGCGTQNHKSQHGGCQGGDMSYDPTRKESMVIDRSVTNNGPLMANNAAAKQYSYSGANVMIICKILEASMSAISTGGSGGSSTDYRAYPASGGGTGMCYLAYQEAL